ncbi:diguanylate cyclase [uncultured Meiothermus sp.]|uniref:diguanylate cyclase n=1 Tax=uncultured Meiothermus sp. TaxID=157471 RepID=UPI0026189252|nr:diguanylate cyclase [uncultured Meiothermus sp.]
MERGLVRTDPLTGARSREGFEEALREILASASVLGLHTSLLILDLDHFKSINDVFGHIRGDQILLEFVGRVSELVRGSDLLFRYGGDEFVLILPQTNQEQAVGLAERLLSMIKSKPFAGDPPLSVSVSVGLATAAPGQEDPQGLFERADISLYAAKRAGRGRLAGLEVLPEGSSGRLLEREAASQSAQRFLKVLPQLRRAALLVAGPEKAGHSGFLREVSQAAKLLGYRVVYLVGRRAYATHPFGALLDGLGLEESERAIAGDWPGLSKRLSEVAQGVVWCVDRLELLDAASLNALQRLMQAGDGPVMGLVLVGTPEARAEAWLGSIPREQVVLTPFSLDATRVFVRTQLRWEAPGEFIGWLWQQSEGLPGRMVQIVQDLRRAKALIPGSEGYALMPDYAQRYEGMGPEIPPALPRPSSSLIGRDREVVALKRLLQERRLVSVTGPGGMGKTHLVSQVAQEVEHLYRDGVLFLSLASLADGAGLAMRLAQEVGLKPRGDEVEALKLHFAQREMLLVLDNLEHLLGGVEFLSRLLMVPGLTILTTSRERLGLPEEWVYELGGLQTVPGDANPLASGAMRLLLQAARRVEPNLNLGGTELGAAQQICSMVEGMPLGLELAAAWVRVLPLSEIAREIRHNQSFLNLPDAGLDRPERHHSLEAAFGSSWAFLEPAQQMILAKLAVFRGGFERKAAEAVAGASVSSLLSLISLSLLKRDLQRQGRYQMHELLRQFALARLSKSPEACTQAQQAHAAFYLNFAEAIAPELKGAQQAEGLERVALELDNLRVALNTFKQTGDAERGLRLMVALEWFFYVRGLFTEGVGWLQEFLPGTVFSTQTQAGGLRVLASLNKELGRVEQSKQQLQESLELFRGIGDVQGTASVLHLLGVIARETGQPYEAQRLLEESLQLRKTVGDLWGVGTSLNDLAIVQAYLGQDAEARELFLKSLEVKRQVGDIQGMAYATANVGHFHDTVEERIAAQEESLALKRKINDHQGIANSLHNLAGIYLQQKNYALAQVRYIEALSLFLELGVPSRLASALLAYAGLLEQLGYLEQTQKIVWAVDHWQGQPGNHLSPASQDTFGRLRHKAGVLPQGGIMGLEELARELIGISGELMF